jgi:hypothetical protein
MDQEAPATSATYNRARNLSGEDRRRGGVKSAERQARDQRGRFAGLPDRPRSAPPEPDQPSTPPPS